MPELEQNPRGARARLAEQLWQYGQLMRLHRPIGTLLLLWPTLWALWIAGDGKPDPLVFLVFALGEVVGGLQEQQILKAEDETGELGAALLQGGELGLVVVPAGAHGEAGVGEEAVDGEDGVDVGAARGDGSSGTCDPCGANRSAFCWPSPSRPTT